MTRIGPAATALGATDGAATDRAATDRAATGSETADWAATGSETADWAAVARVVRRAGFGATGAEVDEAVTLGAQAWVEREMRRDFSTDPGARSTPPPLVPMPEVGSPVDRAALREQAVALTTWWVTRMVAVEHPLLEKLTFGWHEHFATSLAKVKVARLMLGQNDLLRAGARGRFPALASAMLTDPAMLVWLDGRKNRRGAPNENLAREFLELFTLGVGNGYTETDIKEGARALTGWRLEGGTAVWAPARHDGGVKTVFGRSARLDTAGFADVVLSQPGVATHLATRWWHRLAGPGAPPDATLRRVEAAYGADGDLASLFGAILTDPAFPAADGTLVISPVEWVVGVARALRVEVDERTGGAMTRGLRRLGQVPFLPPNVSGWPAGQAWLTTTAAVARAELAAALIPRGDLSAVTDAAPTDRVEATRHLLGIPRLTPATRSTLESLRDAPPRLVGAAVLSPEYLVH